MTAKKQTKTKSTTTATKKCFYCSSTLTKSSQDKIMLCTSCGEDLTVQYTFDDGELTSIFVSVALKGYVNTCIANKGHSIVCAKKNGNYELEAELPDYYLTTHSPSDVKLKLDAMSLFS